MNSSRLKNFLRTVLRLLPMPRSFKSFLIRSYQRYRGFLFKLKRHSPNDFFSGDPVGAMVTKFGQYSVDSPWVLIVDERVPTPDRDSGSVRMFAIVRLIRTMGYNVMFVDDKNIDDSSYTTALQQQGVEVLHGFPSAAEHLHDSGGRYHFALLSRPDTVLRYLPIVRANAIQAKVIYDTVDLHWVRLERALSVSFDHETRKQADFYKQLELMSVSCTDLTLAITAEEKEKLLVEQPDSRIEILPNIHEIDPGSKFFSDRRGLMFIGGFWHEPNVDAIIYFADEILPLIIDQLPDVVLYVVGSNMPESIKSLESEHIKPIGFVPDVSGYFESCKVFVSPLRYGAGMKGKVGQSMAFGLPVVTTSIGAEGMLLDHGRTALIADTPEEFSAAIVQLYTDEALWEMIASNALQHLEANYSMHSARSRIEEIFSQYPVSPPVDGR